MRAQNEWVLLHMKYTENKFKRYEKYNNNVIILLKHLFLIKYPYPLYLENYQLFQFHVYVLP